MATSIQVNPGFYKPDTTVDWETPDSRSKFLRWKREIKRTMAGPLHDLPDDVKVNHVFLWAGPGAEDLLLAKKNVDELKAKDVDDALEMLESLMTYTTYFREARENFYQLQQKPGEKVIQFYSRITQLYEQCKFPPTAKQTLLVDRLIHGGSNLDCKRKLMVSDENTTVKTCFDKMQQFESVS